MYWANLNFENTNKITDILAPLMKYKSKSNREVGYFDFEDSIDFSSIKEVRPLFGSVELKAYEAHILTVIQNLVNDSPTLQELFLFGTLNESQINVLKK